MTISPYLHFRGNCAEAMEFYATLFGGNDLRMLRYADAPTPPEQASRPPSEKIIHAEMSCFGGRLMASDFPPGTEGEPQRAVSVAVSLETVEEARRIYQALLGTALVEFGPSFFSPGFGMVRDRFGTHWILSVPAEG